MNGETITQAEQVKRRSQRLMVRIPIEVAGNNADGKPFKEKTHTLGVSRYGARIALETPVRVRGSVSITNLTSQRACQFTVVNCVEKPVSGVPEWGVESGDLDANFWGIFFPDDGPRGEGGAAATGGVGVPGPRPVRIPPSEATGADRRRSNRVNIKLPVRVRQEDVGETENISKTGVCFSSALEMKIGDRVWLTVGYQPGSTGKEVAARVVWKRRSEGQFRALYGVELEGEPG